jgi:hypothetical protein
VFNYFLERVGDLCSRGLRRLSVLIASQNLPLISSILSRVQFFTQWSVAKNRSDYVHSLPRLWAPQESCRGTNWLIPVGRLPEVLYNVSQWTHANQKTCVAPIFVQTIKEERGNAAAATGHAPGPKKPFLSPVKEEASCAVWYDWFL